MSVFFSRRRAEARVKFHGGHIAVATGVRRVVSKELTWLGSHPVISPEGRYVQLAMLAMTKRKIEEGKMYSWFAHRAVTSNESDS